MQETEARNKWCPFARQVMGDMETNFCTANRDENAGIAPGCSCIGSGCACWQGIEGEGHCGLISR